MGLPRSSRCHGGPHLLRYSRQRTPDARGTPETRPARHPRRLGPSPRRGTELAGYADVQTALDTTLYFCDPHSPWQRGSNENTNRLLRFWIEKGSDLSTHSAEDLRRTAAKLNRRPRPTLDLDTPGQRLNQLLLAA
ncbi:IS30 family transposase [Cryobacterium sp. TMS1-13-1]|nr:IS30 family transposase [Cryobacterium sp. TMS1-13-1]